MKISNFKFQINNNRSGQVLLIVIMLLAVILTVTLAVSFRSTTDTQLTKLEEENQKALAAAEAGIEAALKQGTVNDIGGLSGLSGYTGSATVEKAISTIFTTSLLQKDESYTFYLGKYDEATKTISGLSESYPITICYKSSTPNPALEITLIKQGGIKKYVVDADTSRIPNALPRTSDSCPADASYNFSYIITASELAGDNLLLIVRELFAGGTLLFSRSANFPVQGKTVSSEAGSQTTGVTKKVVLFQSYPQIPAEFFVTSF